MAASAVLPAVAGAATSVKEVGELNDGKAPRCPESCSVVTRTTGIPTSVTGNKSFYSVPANGRIVAWTVTLGAPAAADVTALNKQLGRAKAQLVILRRGKSVNATVVAATTAKTLDPYFGGAVTFALPTSLAVRKGDVLGLSVPSWAPVLVQGYDNSTSWRASRPKGRCGGSTEERKQDYYVNTTLAAGKSGTFNCLYKSERMAYSATFVPTPTRRSSSSSRGASSRERATGRAATVTLR